MFIQMKTMILKKRKALLFLLLLSHFSISAQNTYDVFTPEKEFKNTVRFNLTNPLIFGDKSIIFGYERVLSKHQSFSINIGQTGFPRLNIVNSDELKVQTILKERGFHISGDYRFYLSKENKYDAPRGVYIGPYYGYNFFSKEHSWRLNSSTSNFEGNVNSDLSLRIQTLGVELGYQFIFWKRISLDMVVLGPGVGFYNLKAKLDTDLSTEDSQLFFEKINSVLSDKFPGYNATIGEGEFKKTGSRSVTTLGFRYLIQIGYRF
jgi:hypothetical protein